MTNETIEGIWRGTIYLGKRYRQHAGKEIYFDLEIKQDGNKITGTSTDTGGFGINPDPAKISGEINGKSIKFMKQYSSSHFINRNGEHLVDRSRLGPEIFYTGIFNEQDKTYSGGWIMKVKVKLFWLIPLVFNLNGTWVMKRK